MDKKQAIEKASELMVLAAKHAKDKGATVWNAEQHAMAAGYALRVVFHPKDGVEGLEPTAANYASLFHALYNQSAWRQKFERDEIFPKSGKKSFDSAMAELEEEFGE